MATILPPDFKEFLRLLNSNGVEYLLIGGYAVNYYGYARATADMDVWIALHPQNAERLVSAVGEFGFKNVTADTFLNKQIVRFGVPPFRIELLSAISGVEFENCYTQRRNVLLDGIPVSLISLEQLKANKRAAGLLKDLNDLEQLKTPE